MEQTFCVDTSIHMIHGDLTDDGSGWFPLFIQRASNLMKEIGLVKEGGTDSPVNSMRAVGCSGWREELPGFSAGGTGSSSSNFWNWPISASYPGI